MSISNEFVRSLPLKHFNSVFIPLSNSIVVIPIGNKWHFVARGTPGKQRESLPPWSDFLLKREKKSGPEAQRTHRNIEHGEASLIEIVFPGRITAMLTLYWEALNRKVPMPWQML